MKRAMKGRASALMISGSCSAQWCFVGAFWRHKQTPGGGLSIAAAARRTKCPQCIFAGALFLSLSPLISIFSSRACWYIMQPPLESGFAGGAKSVKILFFPLLREARRVLRSTICKSMTPWPHLPPSNCDRGSVECLSSLWCNSFTCSSPFPLMTLTETKMPQISDVMQLSPRAGLKASAYSTGAKTFVPSQGRQNRLM